MRLRILIAAVALAAAPGARAAEAQPPIRHVWTIVLGNKDYAQTFGSTPGSRYLGTRLPAAGALLTEYYATGHMSLTNYVAMISGQAPNPVTQSDCQIFQDFAAAGTAADGQAVGQGCVYPSSIETIADQLTAEGLTYRGYMQDMGADPTREPATCAHPPLNAPDNTRTATPQDQYATRHNPFAYFHSIIDDQGACDRTVVNLDLLEEDLESVRTTPNYSFITPDLCANGHDETCADPKQKGGYEGIDEFLREWVPKILASPAYRRDGLLIVTFDEAENDATACCNEPSGPNTPSPGIDGPGGGRIGAVLLSPLIRRGTENDTPINHYGYLRSLEDLFGLEHLGYAALDATATFQSMNLFITPAKPAANPVRAFRLERKGKRLTIRVHLAAGVIGRIAISHEGRVVRRFVTGGRAIFQVRVPRKARVVLRAERDGKTVRRLRRAA